MNNLEIFVRHDCTACEGEGTRRNPNYDEFAQFPEEEIENCPECRGTKKIERFVSLEELALWLENNV